MQLGAREKGLGTRSVLTPHITNEAPTARAVEAALPKATATAAVVGGTKLDTVTLCLAVDRTINNVCEDGNCGAGRQDKAIRTLSRVK